MRLKLALPGPRTQPLSAITVVLISDSGLLERPVHVISLMNDILQKAF